MLIAYIMLRYEGSTDLSHFSTEGGEVWHEYCQEQIYNKKIINFYGRNQQIHVRQESRLSQFLNIKRLESISFQNAYDPIICHLTF